MKKIGEKINIFDEYGVQVEAQIKLNNNLSGDSKLLRGLARLRNGSYVLMWEDEWDHQICTSFIDEETALQEILKSGNTSLLQEERFMDLHKLLNNEWEDEEETEMKINGAELINVYDLDENEVVIGRVRPTDNLKLDNEVLSIGLTRLKNGKFVLVREVEGGNYIAKLVDAWDALQMILQRGKDYLLDEPKFHDLKFLYNETIEQEWE